MGLMSKEIASLDDLFVHSLRTTYYAEKQITKALPKMIEKASAPELREGFQAHLRETERQVERLDQVFRMHGAEPKETDCPAIDGILKAGERLASNISEQSVLDAALIAAGQMVEHYEIAQYGSLIAWARQMGRDDCARLLGETLNEEKATDQKLTRLAESHVNRSAHSKAA